MKTASDGTELAMSGLNYLEPLEQLPEYCYCAKGYVVLRHTAYGAGKRWAIKAITEAQKATTNMRIINR